jgi:hypothetical protein
MGVFVAVGAQAVRFDTAPMARTVPVPVTNSRLVISISSDFFSTIVIPSSNRRISAVGGYVIPGDLAPLWDSGKKGHKFRRPDLKGTKREGTPKGKSLALWGLHLIFF